MSESESEATLSFIPWAQGPAILFTVLYALYTALVFFALFRTLRRVKTRSRPSNAFSVHREKVLGGGSARFTWQYVTFIGSIVLMWFFTTAMLAHCWWTRAKYDSFMAQHSKATLTNSPGDKGQAPTLVMGLNVLIADIILIWRCWLLYGCTYGIVMLPVIGVLLDIALFVIVELKSMSTDLIRLLYPCTSLCITLYCTVAIGFKMLRYKKVKGYAIMALVPALEIIAETALVYTAALIAMIGCHIALSSKQADAYSMVLVAVTAGACPTWILASTVMGNSSVEEQTKETKRHTLDLTAGEDEWSELDSVYKYPLPSPGV
ncbi:hypothetical protein CYLTODRAFT_493909 [Cylindrobasidium torrendii FP15055 ss-10]|uniref:Uncharacterized protein n=1 Tax=Cylindrobasidium torrendii FP15055 ss-10 TaxID=1314674 RepID=A0A0D7AZ10_9AGAR|nr:hypothetical protein CYLTODRAFT_493909 [Cylindrobasidium torrendii FP15055 ss-10]